MMWSPTRRSSARRSRVDDQMRKPRVASVVRSFRRPKTAPPRGFHVVISPSTHTEPQFDTKSRIVSFSRETDVGACGDESRGRTESGGGALPGRVSGWKVVMRSFRARAVFVRFLDAV